MRSWPCWFYSDEREAGLAGQKNETRRANLLVFTGLITFILLYGCEAWALSAAALHRLQMFYNRYDVCSMCRTTSVQNHKMAFSTFPSFTDRIREEYQNKIRWALPWQEKTNVDWPRSNCTDGLGPTAALQATLGLDRLWKTCWTVTTFLGKEYS